MKSSWQRLGKIFEVSPELNNGGSHSAVPFAVPLGHDAYRVYFSTRDPENRSHTSSFDYSLSERRIIDMSEELLFGPGERGHFDDCGVTMSGCISEENKYYYMGWSLPKTVPFSNEIGLAELDENSRFRRSSNRPVIGKCEKEPLSFGYPWVLKTDSQYMMWYDTILSWPGNSTDDYEFVLRAAVSQNGVSWEKIYDVEFPFLPGERAIARPCIEYENGIFRMWASIDKYGKYSLCYAESKDGFLWQRCEFNWSGHETPGEWESDEQAYPFVFKSGTDRFMLYNGNSYGRTGIGLAVELR